MAEKLEIVVSAKDQASPAIKAVGATVKAEMQQIAGATGKATAATSQMATASVTGFAHMQAAVSKYRTQIAAAGAAVTGASIVMGIGLKSAVDAALEAAHSQQRLSAAITATGQSISSAKLMELAQHLSQVTRFSHEETEAMMANLVAMGFNEQQVTALTPIIQNLAAVMDKDLITTARLVGVSIQKNVPTMSRFGVVIDAAAWSAASFGEKLAILNSHSKDAAETMGKGADAVAIMHHQMDEAKEAIGTALLPALQAITPLVKDLAVAVKWLAEKPLGRYFIEAAAGATVLMKVIGPIATAVGGFAMYKGMGKIAAAIGGAKVLSTAPEVATAAAPAIAAEGATAAAPVAVAEEIAGGAVVGGLASKAVGAATKAAPALARVGRGALGVAGRAALPVAIALEAAHQIGAYQEQMDNAERILSDTRYTPRQQAFMEKWRREHGQEIERAKIAEEVAKAAAGAEPDFATSAALSAAAAAELAKEPDFGKRLARYRKQGLGGIATSINNRTRNVDVSARDTAQGEELLIRVQTSKPESDDTDQAVANYLDDMQYAEVE